MFSVLKFVVFRFWFGMLRVKEIKSIFIRLVELNKHLRAFCYQRCILSLIPSCCCYFFHETFDHKSFFLGGKHANTSDGLSCLTSPTQEIFWGKGHCQISLNFVIAIFCFFINFQPSFSWESLADLRRPCTPERPSWGCRGQQDRLGRQCLDVEMSWGRKW